MIAETLTGTPTARFAVSGIGFHYSVWDNARQTVLLTGNPFHKRLDDAYAMAEFMNRHVPGMNQTPALPAGFMPVATDTGTVHGPHPVILLDMLYRPIATFPTVHDAHAHIIDTAETIYRESIDEYGHRQYRQMPQYYVSPTPVVRSEYYHARHPFWSYDNSEYMTIDATIRNTIARMARDEQNEYRDTPGIATQLLRAFSMDLTPETPGNYLFIDYDKAQIGYHPRGRVYLAREETLAQSGRVTGKTVRVLKTLFPTVTGSDAEWEKVNTRLGAVMKTEGEFVLLTGDELLDAYCADNYAPTVTWHSCMSYPYCRSYLRLYADNPESVKLLVLRNDQGETMARSLIWTTDGGMVYQDRIYANNDRDTHRMRTYAADTLGALRHTADTVSLRNYANLSEYPYMDTFTYYDPNTGLLSPDESIMDGEYYVLSSTDGNYEVHGGIRRYAVSVSRTVTEYAIIYVDASDEYDAEMMATDQIRWETDDIEVNDVDTGRWHITSVDED